ncbi:aliphatic sulfonate ABC transporter substrate-binding protein [Streptomyces tubbatahanensis]|uniref:Aliphatic sulfonate ABC transporter substrate-binding protein n=1 Tax=Streptomyces tubbatahanensis TaxID=2923272 RepID=A0ABY3XLT6_9ACTN|nr:aliphatic sulfonate ABC transporter substrate-binding protein [Streptomyces tubbatahanensis]UNS95359.1 aliphatic sulfonate ABC transporter substrate-binding protein [Streptomyces tubbatahanensis]
MTIRTRSLPGALVLALLLVAGAVTGCGGDEAASRHARGEVTFGYTADYSGAAALAVAQKRGLWRGTGLTPRLKRFTNGPLQVQALGSEDLDFGYLGPGALWMSATGRAPVIAVNMLGQADRVVARPGSGIRTAADLKGKKVAVAEGTSGDMILHLALRRAGLKTSDITKIGMDAGTVVTAVSSGNVDAAATWYPLVDTMRDQVPGLREIVRTQDFSPKMTFPNVFVTQPELASRDPELVTEVVGVLRRANDWIVRHPAASEKVVADFLDVPASRTAGSTRHVQLLTSREKTDLGREGTLQRWFDALAQVFHEMTRLPGREDPDDYYLQDLYARAATAPTGKGVTR